MKKLKNEEKLTFRSSLYFEVCTIHFFRVQKKEKRKERAETRNLSFLDRYVSSRELKMV